MARRKPLLPVLWRKLLRDLWSRKFPLGALIIVITVGVGSYVGMASLYRDMAGARNRYYAAYRLSDFSVDMKRAPASAVELARAHPNVEAVRGEVEVAARIDLPGRSEPIIGTAISMPTERTPQINDLLIMSGAWFSGQRGSEVILNHEFAKANDLRPGKTIDVILIDRQHTLLIVGTARSPQYVYLMGAGGLAPDEARFGVMYIPEAYLQEACDLEGAYNQLVGWTHDSSDGAIARTLDDLEQLMDPYGATGSRATTDEASVQFLNDEITGLEIQSRVTPAIFLVVAALVLNLMLGRLVAQQRSTIGILRALGHTRWAIRRHYLAFGIAVGFTGGTCGIAFAWWIQAAIMTMYREFYKMPGMDTHFHPDIALTGMGISLGCAMLGTIKGVRFATLLEPAEAMHPPPPERGRRVFLEWIPFLWKPLPFRWKMILRAVLRNPLRSGTTVLATLLSTSIIVLSFNQVIAIDFLMDYTFSKLLHQDVTVSLREPQATSASRELAGLPGITDVEPQLAVACTLTHGTREKRIGITGLPRHGRLLTPLDRAGNPIVIPDQGVILSQRLADTLGVGPGDVLRLRPLIGRRETVETPVVATFDTYMGISAYADIDYLSGLVGERSAANVYLARTAGGIRGDPLLEEVKKRPGVVGIDERTRGLERMEETFGETMGTMIWIMVGLAGLVGFACVLNATLVSLSERRREVGTLRVLGYAPFSISGIFSGESLLVGTLGIALGMFGGIGLTFLLASLLTTELFRFPVLIVPAELLRAAAVMIGFIAAAQAVVFWRIRRIDWLEAVKSRE